jgi:hypothetical protein
LALISGSRKAGVYSHQAGQILPWNELEYLSGAAGGPARTGVAARALGKLGTIDIIDLAMALAPRSPSPAESRRRTRRLGMVRRSTPIARLLGRRGMTGWLRRQMNSRAAERAGFLAPLAWVEAAWGGLPAQTLEVGQVSTILADWVDCGGVMRNTTDCFLGSGDWLPLIRSTDGDPVREEARQLQAASLVYASTPAYEALVRAAQSRDPQRRQGRTLHVRQDVEAYFERFVALYRSIEARGMLPLHELEGAGARYNQDRGLGIAVDADGRLHRLQGANHRWAIAQVLQLVVVPVEVRLFHVRSALLARSLG